MSTKYRRIDGLLEVVYPAFSDECSKYMLDGIL
jgi:hypothetical protein